MRSIYPYSSVLPTWSPKFLFFIDWSGSARHLNTVCKQLAKKIENLPRIAYVGIVFVGSTNMTFVRIDSNTHSWVFETIGCSATPMQPHESMRSQTLPKMPTDDATVLLPFDTAKNSYLPLTPTELFASV